MGPVVFGSKNAKMRNGLGIRWSQPVHVLREFYVLCVPKREGKFAPAKISAIGPAKIQKGSAKIFLSRCYLDDIMLPRARGALARLKCTVKF
jgi:hypothetical protein